MKARDTLLVPMLVSILLNACKLEQQQGEDDSRTNENSTALISNEEDSPTKKVLINDDFIFEALENDLSITRFQSTFDLVDKEIVPNRHNTSLNDTILTFGNDMDSASFYASATSAILQRAVLASPDITLTDSIRVGENEALLGRRLGLKKVPDSLMVKDLENSSHFLFILENGVIERIVYRASYID